VGGWEKRRKGEKEWGFEWLNNNNNKKKKKNDL
jgi:hypothetical protein